MRAMSASQGIDLAYSYRSIKTGNSRPYSNSKGEFGGGARIWERAIARKNSTPVMRWTAGYPAARASIRLTVTLLRYTLYRLRAAFPLGPATVCGVALSGLSTRGGHAAACGAPG